MSITKLDYILHLVSSYYQVDDVHFDISAASGFVQHSLLLHILGACGPVHDCLNWFQSYLTGRLLLVKIFFFLCPTRLCVWGLCILIYLLMVFVL